MEEEQEKSEKEETKEVDIMALISYIGPLCLIPLFSKGEDEFVKFHANQGLLLFIAEVATWFLFKLIPLFGILGNIIGLVWIVLSIQGIIHVVNGKEKEVALIGQYAKKVEFKI